MPDNIRDVVKGHLCCQCGACVAVCSNRALQMTESPAGMLIPFVSDKCVHCGECLKVCPGAGVDVALPESVDPFRGEVVDSYVGHASNHGVRAGGQSGGVVSAVLLFLLDTGQIDAALVTTMRESGELLPTPVLATARQDILSARGSKYCPVALNAVFRDVGLGKRLAVVGLPCHIHGVKKLAHSSVKKSLDVAYKIGLFCDRTLLYSCVDQMAKDAGIGLSEINKIEYRSKERVGWPGEVCFHLKSGNKRFFSSSLRMRLKDYFTPPRCRICFDKTNIFSDISIGDSWGVSDSEKGDSVVIARSQKGSQLLKAASAAGYLSLKTASVGALFEGQAVDQRRKDFFAYLEEWGRLGKKQPEYKGLKGRLPGLSYPFAGASYRQKLLLNILVVDAKTRQDALRGVSLWLIKEKFNRLISKMGMTMLWSKKHTVPPLGRGIRVVHFQRKRNPDFFSMESIFDTVRKCLPNEICCSVAESRFLGVGFFKRVYNMVEAAFRQGDVNHITGDVHFLVYFMRPRKTIVTVLDCGCLAEATRLKKFILWLFWYVLPLKLAACVTVISEAAKTDLLRHVKLHPDKIRVIPCCISPAFTYSPTQFNSAKPRVLLVGARPNKNISRILDALEGVPCQLEIVGRLSREDAAKISICKFEHTVSVNISEADMVEKYRICDMLVFPSTYEGFGLPILEANAVGRPVITSNTSSMPEVAGNAACLVDPFDAQSIKKGILSVIGNPAYREELVLNGLENIKRFSPSRIAGQYSALYCEICHGTRVTPEFRG